MHIHNKHSNKKVSKLTKCSVLWNRDKERLCVFKFKPAYWAKKCSQRAQSGGATELHDTTGYFLSVFSGGSRGGLWVP